MKNPMDELLDSSKDWIILPRASKVAEAAASFLRSTFQIDAGFISYGRRPREDGTDYLRTVKRWFMSWGLDTQERELQQAIKLSSEFAPNVTQRQWFSTEELPSIWKDILHRNQVNEVGIWIVNFDRRPVGLIVLARKARHHSDDKEVISRCMAHISVVLELVITRRLAEELSSRDPLTGALNRRGLLSEFDSLTVGNAPLTIIVVDLDRFKEFNDQHGHIAGDEILRKVADVLDYHAQEYSGICARFGGDEFVLVDRCATEDPVQVARRIVNELLDVGVKASAGCASLGSDGADFDACYRVADRRLYEMKKERRKDR